MTSFQIAAARPEHIEHLCLIGAECGLSTWTPQGYESEMQRADAVILIAQDEPGQIVGFIAGRLVAASNEPQEGSAEIYNIGTRASFRNIGVGSELLTQFLNACRRRGVSQVWLEVRASNEPGIAFYRVHGFVRTGTRRNFYAAPVEDAEVMYLQLKDRGNQ